MTNKEALRNLCNAMANTFYPDQGTIELALFNEGIDAAAEATPKDPEIFRLAVGLIRGMVVSINKSNGLTVSAGKVRHKNRWATVDVQSNIELSIKHYCKLYGIDYETI